MGWKAVESNMHSVSKIDMRTRTLSNHVPCMVRKTHSSHLMGTRATQVFGINDLQIQQDGTELSGNIHHVLE